MLCPVAARSAGAALGQPDSNAAVAKNTSRHDDVRFRCQYSWYLHRWSLAMVYVYVHKLHLLLLLYYVKNTGIYTYKSHLLLLHVQVTLIITTKLLVLVACSLCRVYLSSLRPCRGKDCKNYSTLTARGAARTHDAPGSSDGELDRGR